jgi:hypothetical protein
VRPIHQSAFNVRRESTAPQLAYQRLLVSAPKAITAPKEPQSLAQLTIFARMGTYAQQALKLQLSVDLDITLCKQVPQHVLPALLGSTAPTTSSESLATKEVTAQGEIFLFSVQSEHTALHSILSAYLDALAA